MPKRRRKHEGLPGFRESSPDRKLMSLQDWYGFGFLAAMTDESITHGVRYAGARATEDQVDAGYRHALMLKIEIEHDAERQKLH